MYFYGACYNNVLLYFKGWSEKIQNMTFKSKCSIKPKLNEENIVQYHGRKNHHLARSNFFNELKRCF